MEAPPITEQQELSTEMEPQAALIIQAAPPEPPQTARQAAALQEQELPEPQIPMEPPELQAQVPQAQLQKMEQAPPAPLAQHLIQMEPEQPSQAPHPVRMQARARLQIMVRIRPQMQ